MKKIIRNLSHDSGRAFWDSAEKSAAPVKAWPEWKKAGIDVQQSGVNVPAPKVSQVKSNA